VIPSNPKQQDLHLLKMPPSIGRGQWQNKVIISKANDKTHQLKEQESLTDLGHSLWRSQD